MKLGVVLSRRKITHKWQDHAWRVEEVIPGAPELGEWRLLRQNGAEVVYLAATLPVDLYPGEASNYRHNLSQREPKVYVVLRSDAENSERPVRPFQVTVCPAEAQDYLDGDEVVEAVPMPAAVAAWLQDYVRRFPVEREFEKRGRAERDARRSARRRDG